MKRMIFALLIALFAISAMGNGTVRVYTGNGAWSFQIEGDPTLYVAANVDHYGAWDRSDSTLGPPNPWEKLYYQNPLSDGYWIGMEEEGFDTIPHAGNETMWFISPTFLLQSNISRATIWMAVDDAITVVQFRNLQTDTAYIATGVVAGGYTDFERYDLTDFLRTLPPSNQGYRLEIRVINIMPFRVGLISYFSYDYGAPRDYTYSLSDMGFRYVSLPFKPTDPSATLSSMFPHLLAAHWFNWETGSWQALNITSPLTGTLGDIVRTYTIRLWYATPQIHNTTIEGYPIFEQRYLDIMAIEDLYFGTINCDCKPGLIGYVRFDNSYPDDLWWDKITGTTNWSYYCHDAVNWNTPTWEVLPKRAYYSIPHSSCTSCSYPCLPYHLDLINYSCRWPCKSEPEGEYFSSTEDTPGFLDISPTPIEFSEDIIDYYERLQDSLMPYIHIPDSSEVCERFPHLCEDYDLDKRALGQNRTPTLELTTSPSPFNAELSISISAPKDDYLTVAVYNNSGHLVKVLFDNEVISGTQRLVWNGHDSGGNEMPTGQYLIRATTRKDVQIKKVILIK